jgi:hypothetical protein
MIETPPAPEIAIEDAELDALERHGTDVRFIGAATIIGWRRKNASESDDHHS